MPTESEIPRHQHLVLSPRQLNLYGSFRPTNTLVEGGCD